MPKHRRTGLLRRCQADSFIRQALDQGRLSQRYADVLDYRLGVSDGYAHTLKETCGRFGVTPVLVRRLEAKLFGERVSALSTRRLRAAIRLCFRDPDWARKVLAECDEACQPAADSPQPSEEPVDQNGMTS